MKEFVKVQDITKTYKMGEVEIHAVDHISFSIEQGELVVIVGHDKKSCSLSINSPSYDRISVF